MGKKRKVAKKKAAPTRKATAAKKQARPTRKAVAAKKKAARTRKVAATKTARGDDGYRDEAMEFFRRSRAGRFFPS